MKTMGAIHHHTNNAKGVRCFSDAATAVMCGENPATLHSVGGILVKWPQSLGAPPTEQDVTAWIVDFDAYTELQKKKGEAEKALQAYVLENALNDPNAPQAVKDYKAEKDK